jgi:hypothetical protein
MDNNTTSLINPRFYRAVSPNDQKHVTRLAFFYELPFRFSGPGWERVWRQALGGWSVSGLAQFATGTPLSVSHTFGRPLRVRSPKLSGPVYERLGDQRVAGRVVNPYFDVTAFTPLPNQYTVTPEPPALDELRSPDTRSLNVAIFKAFPIRERLRLELRLESTGFTNTPNFAAPGTNLSNAATFGVVSSAGGSRSMQGSVRVAF